MPGAPAPEHVSIRERIVHFFEAFPLLNIWIILFFVLLFFAILFWCFRRRRNKKRWYFWPLPLAVVVLVVAIGAGANWHMGYYANAGDLIGSHPFPTGSAQLLAKPHGKFPRGVTVSALIPGTTSNVGSYPAYIWLPPQFFEAQQGERFPVVYLLAGSPGTPADWFIGGGASESGLALAQAGKPSVIVSPSVGPTRLADTECVNGAQGNWETYLAVDVPEWVEKNPHLDSEATFSGPTSNIAGLSMGGFCAQMLALRHPDRFTSSGNFSGSTAPDFKSMEELFGPVPNLDATVKSYDTKWIIQNKPDSRAVNTWLEIGSADQQVLIDDQKSYVAAARALKMNAPFEETQGSHNFYVWCGCLQPWLNWAWDTSRDQQKAKN